MHPHDLAPPYRFCPVCGAALERRIVRSGEPERLACASTSCRFVFYLDPKLAVGAIVRCGSDRRIVLVRRAIQPGYGKWVFPGGYVDRGEEMTIAAVREAREETGLEVRIDRLINVYSYSGHTPIIAVYAATRVGGELAVDEEGLEVREFDVAEIPWDELAFRSTREALREYLSGTTPSIP